MEGGGGEQKKTRRFHHDPNTQHSPVQRADRSQLGQVQGFGGGGRGLWVWGETGLVKKRRAAVGVCWGALRLTRDAPVTARHSPSQSLHASADPSTLNSHHDDWRVLPTSRTPTRDVTHARRARRRPRRQQGRAAGRKGRHAGARTGGESARRRRGREEHRACGRRTHTKTVSLSRVEFARHSLAHKPPHAAFSPRVCGVCGRVRVCARVRREKGSELLARGMPGATDMLARGAASTAARARGAFIVLEGVDRCGKTTQCKRLVETLKAKGVSLVVGSEGNARERRKLAQKCCPRPSPRLSAVDTGVWAVEPALTGGGRRREGSGRPGNAHS